MFINLFNENESMGLGIAQVVEPRLDVLSKMYILSFDLSPESVDWLEKGVIQTVITQNPYEMGTQSIDKMRMLLEGDRVESYSYMKNEIIRKEDIPLNDDHFMKMGMSQIEK